MNTKIKQCLMAGGGLAASMLVAVSANAFTLIDDYDFYFDNTGPSAGNAVDTFLGGSGGFMTDINAFQSDGNSWVIQQATGAGGAVQTGDRYYEIGYLRLSTADVGGVTTGLGDLYGGGDNSMYFFFELGGTVNLSGIPTYSVDMGSINLMVDNDGGLLAGALDPLMNRASDGASFAGLMDAFAADLLADNFVMPGAGGSAINPNSAINPGAIDGSILSLNTLQFLAGSGGEIPTGFGVPNSQQTGDFGIDMAVTQCLVNVQYNMDGDDLCSFANIDAALSGFFWAVSGQTTGKNQADAVIYNNTNGLYITQTLTIGDTADIGETPEPATLALLSLGLLGMGTVARRRSRKYQV